MRDHVQRLQIARDDEGNASFDAFLTQPGIDRVLALAAPDDSDMPGKQELIQSPQAGSSRMAAPDRERFGVGEKTLPVKARERLVGARDDEIDRTRQLGGHDCWAEPGRHIKPDEQQRHHEIDDVIGHHEREAARAGSGIEGFGDKKAANLVEHLCKRRS